jgi:hypothetical protein
MAGFEIVGRSGPVDPLRELHGMLPGEASQRNTSAGVQISACDAGFG